MKRHFDASRQTSILHRTLFASLTLLAAVWFAYLVLGYELVQLKFGLHEISADGFSPYAAGHMGESVPSNFIPRLVLGLTAAGMSLFAVVLMFSSSFAFSKKVFVLFSTCIGFLIVTVFWRTGPFGHDTFVHLFRIKEVFRLLLSGQFDIYISPGSGDGKGLPVYAFYSSWIYFLPALFLILSIPAYMSLKLSFLTLYVLSGFFIYASVRPLVRKQAALSGSLIYLTSSYLLTDMFTRSSFAEFYGFFLLPLIFLFLNKWLHSRKIQHGMWVLCFSTLLVVMHPITAMNALPGLVTYVLFFFVQERSLFKKNASQYLRQILLGTIFLGGLSAFFWVPILFESRLIQLSRPIFVSWLFVAPKDLFRFYGSFHPGYMLLLALLVSFVLLIYRIRKRDAAWMELGLFVVILSYFFLMTVWSSPIWELLSFLKYNQFPFRLMLPFTFFSAVLITLQINKLMQRPSFSEWQIPAVLSVFLLLQSAFFISPELAKVPFMRRTDFKASLTRYMERTEGLGKSEYLPRTDRIPTIARDQIAGGLHNVQESKHKAKIQLVFQPVQTAGYYQVDRFWTPRYTISTNGGDVPFLATPEGLLAVSLQPGIESLNIQIRKPPYVFWARGLSAAVLAFLIFMFFREKRYS